MTTGQRLVQLSGLASATAMTHLLAITAGVAAGIVTVSAGQAARVSTAGGVGVRTGASVSVSVPGGATVGTSSGVTARV